MLTYPRELWFERGLFLHFPSLVVCPQPLPHPPDDGLPHPTTGNTSLLATHRAPPVPTCTLYSLHTHTNKVLVGHGLEVPSSVRENGSAVSFIFDGKAGLAQSHNPDPTNHIADCFHVCDSKSDSRCCWLGLACKTKPCHVCIEGDVNLPRPLRLTGLHL